MTIFFPSDFFDTNYGFMAGFMRQPWWASYITNGIDTSLAGCAPLVGQNMAAINFDIGRLKAKIFGIPSNANSKNHPACLQWLVLAFDTGLNAVCIACHRLQFDAGHNGDAALFE